jgi:hypothetical protein
MSTDNLAEAVMLLTGVCGISGLNFRWKVILLTKGFLFFSPISFRQEEAV